MSVEGVFTIIKVYTFDSEDLLCIKRFPVCLGHPDLNLTPEVLTFILNLFMFY